MMGRDAALPLAPASVALGRGPSLCPHAVVRAPAARHALRPGRGPPAGGAQRVPDPAFRVRVACRGQRTPSRRRLARRGRRGPADHRPRAGGRGRVGAGGGGRRRSGRSPRTSSPPRSSAPAGSSRGRSPRTTGRPPPCSTSTCRPPSPTSARHAGPPALTGRCPSGASPSSRCAAWPTATRSPSRVIPERIEPTRATRVRSVPGTGRRAGTRSSSRAGPERIRPASTRATRVRSVLGTGRRAAARSPSRATRERNRPARALLGTERASDGRAGRTPAWGGRRPPRGGGGRRSPLGRPRPHPPRLATRSPARPARRACSSRAHVGSGSGRRPAVSLLCGLVVVIVLAVLVVFPTRSRTAQRPPRPRSSPRARFNGLALGDDRLPDCAPVVASLSPRQKLAQRLMVGVNGADPAATARLVHEMQIGGIFVGGTATGLLTGQALRGVQAASRLPLAVAVDDEGGRVQRVDGLDGDLPSARTLASTVGTAEVQQIARNRGRVLAASGVTMNFAPDVDVSDQPNGAVIGDRSFSSDPDTRHRLRRRLRRRASTRRASSPCSSTSPGTAGPTATRTAAGSPPRRSTSSRRATSPRTPGCCAPGGRWPTRR